MDKRVGSSATNDALGVSVMRADIGAATSTSVDVHEAQWRAGVNRQAREDAAAHQRAAAQALGRKRRASAMTADEKEEADRRNADRRNDAKRAKRAAAKGRHAAESTAVAADATGLAPLSAVPTTPAPLNPASLTAVSAEPLPPLSPPQQELLGLSHQCNAVDATLTPQPHSEMPVHDEDSDPLMDDGYPGCLGSSVDVPHGGLYRGCQVTITGLRERTDLNGQLATLKVWCHEYEPERWKVRCEHNDEELLIKSLNLKPVKPIAGPVQPPRSRCWRGMTVRAIRTCTNPPPSVPCDKLLELNSMLPEGFFAFNETNFNYFAFCSEDGACRLSESEARAAGHVIPVATMYVHVASGRRSLIAPTATDGPPRGYVPRFRAIGSEIRGNHRYLTECGDPACSACPVKVP